MCVCVEPDPPCLEMFCLQVNVQQTQSDQEGSLCSHRDPEAEQGGRCKPVRVGTHFLRAKARRLVMPSSSEPRLWQLSPQHLLLVVGGGVLGGLHEPFPGETWCLDSSLKSLDVLRAEQYYAGHCSSLAPCSVPASWGRGPHLPGSVAGKKRGSVWACPLRGGDSGNRPGAGSLW